MKTIQFSVIGVIRPHQYNDKMGALFDDFSNEISWISLLRLYFILFLWHNYRIQIDIDKLNIFNDE